MALQRILSRTNDVDIQKAYARISGIGYRTIPSLRTTVVFTIIGYTTYLDKAARDNYPEDPIEDTQVKIMDWRPDGIGDKQTSSAYIKLAEVLGVENIEI